VIPAFNEEVAIAGIVARVLAQRDALASAGVQGPEVIVVDDGSRDRTASIARALVGVTVIRHDVNRGYGAALKTGLAHAGGELVGFVDADGTYPPEHFPQLCAVALDGADLVIGSRMGAERTGMPWTRRVGNRFFARMITVLGTQPVGDCASGMRVLRRAILPQLYPLPDGLNFTPIMSLRAVHEGIRVVEVPIAYHERIGASKLSVVRDGWRYVRSILWTALGYNPVRVLGGVGLGAIALALTIACGLVVARAQGITTIGPWGVAAIFTALVTGVSGVSLFSLGVTFNYLVSLFRKEPQRVGVFGRPLFRRPLERHFGWLGLALATLGMTVASTALALGVNGWEIARLWLYLVGSALLMLVGLQLIICRVLVSKLQELAARELHTTADLTRTK
jgi:hypothetical protein